MLARASTRWIVAALVASALSGIGCGRAASPRRPQMARLITADDTVVHAFDTEVEVRLIDRLQLDNFLRERDIHLRVIDGTVSITGEVWTALEKERVSELVRGVPGVVDVANELTIKPPA